MPYKHGKEILSETEDKLVLGIPLVRWIRPVVVQPQSVFIVFQLEDVRVAVAVSFVWRAILATANLITQSK